jgi:hypothetical protein
MHDRILRHDMLLPSDLSFKDLIDQLKISQFCNDVTKTLYCDISDPIGLIPVDQREVSLTSLQNNFIALESRIGISPTSKNIPFPHIL